MLLFRWGFVPPLVAAVIAATPPTPFPAGTYHNSSTYDSGAFHLHWRVEGGRIFLGLQVQTDGYVGFGLGDPASGSMPGADIVVAWVDANGLGHVEDRYGAPLLGPAPLLDACQDWELEEATQTNGWTTFRINRALATDGDLQDRPISAGLTKILWAHGATDAIAYHGSKRGVGGVAFYGVLPDVGVNNIVYGAADTFLLPNAYHITAEKTVYHDAPFKVPSVSVLHVIGLKHWLDKATQKYVHHMVLYGARKDSNGNDHVDMLWAWAPGVGPLVLPPEAGIRVGQEVGAYYTFTQNVHYDNPAGDGVGLVDRSGIILKYTTKMRPHDAAVLQLGDPLIKQQAVIPKGTGETSFHYHCPAACTSQWPKALNVFGVFQHMHKAGARSVTSHYRNKQQITDLARVDFYSFDFQTTLPSSATILPGDEFRTTCTYNRRADKDIKFADASEDEMCVVFVYVWPPPPTGYCGHKTNAYCGDPPPVQEPASVFDVRFGRADPSLCPVTPTPTTTTTDKPGSVTPTATTMDTSGSVTTTTDKSGPVTLATTITDKSGSVTSNDGNQNIKDGVNSATKFFPILSVMICFLF